MVIQAELVFLQFFFSAHATRQKEEKWIVNFLEPVEQSHDRVGDVKILHAKVRFAAIYNLSLR